MEDAPRYFTDIDWASDKHNVPVINANGAFQTHLVIAHTAEGLALSESHRAKIASCVSRGTKDTSSKLTPASVILFAVT